MSLASLERHGAAEKGQFIYLSRPAGVALSIMSASVCFCLEMGASYSATDRAAGRVGGFRAVVMAVDIDLAAVVVHHCEGQPAWAGDSRWVTPSAASEKGRSLVAGRCTLLRRRCASRDSGSPTCGPWCAGGTRGTDLVVCLSVAGSEEGEVGLRESERAEKRGRDKAFVATGTMYGGEEEEETQSQAWPMR